MDEMLTTINILINWTVILGETSILFSRPFAAIICMTAHSMAEFHRCVMTQMS